MIVTSATANQFWARVSARAEILVFGFVATSAVVVWW